MEGRCVEEEEEDGGVLLQLHLCYESETSCTKSVGTDLSMEDIGNLQKEVFQLREIITALEEKLKQQEQKLSDQSQEDVHGCESGLNPTERLSSDRDLLSEMEDGQSLNVNCYADPKSEEVQDSGGGQQILENTEEYGASACPDMEEGDSISVSDTNPTESVGSKALQITISTPAQTCPVRLEKCIEKLKKDVSDGEVDVAAEYVDVIPTGNETLTGESMHCTVLQSEVSPVPKRCSECCTKFHCPFCSPAHYKPRHDTYSVKNHLQCHMKRAIRERGYIICMCHLDCREKSHFHCPICAKTVMRKSDAQSHISSCQGISDAAACKEKLYTCSYCGETFRNKPHLVYHQRIHTEEEHHIPVQEMHSGNNMDVEEGVSSVNPECKTELISVFTLDSGHENQNAEQGMKENGDPAENVQFNTVQLSHSTPVKTCPKRPGGCVERKDEEMSFETTNGDSIASSKVAVTGIHLHCTVLQSEVPPVPKRCSKCCTKFHCPFCPPALYKPRHDTYSVKNHLQCHMKRAIRERGYTICMCNLGCRVGAHFHCPICSRTLVRKKDAQGHISSCQGKNDVSLCEEKPHLCSYCGKTFRNEPDLFYHQRIHTGEEPYSALETLSGDNMHFTVLQSDVPPVPQRCTFCCTKFHCPFCPPTRYKPRHDMYSVKNHLKCHVKRAIRERGYIICMCHLDCRGKSHFHCPICAKTVVRKDDAQSHISSCQGPSVRAERLEGPHSCSDCGKILRSQRNLINHRRIHTGEKPYLCPQCGKLFISLGSFSAHQKSHNVDTPYRCSACGKSFKHKSVFLNHQRRHSGEKPYLCSTCGKQLSCRTSLSAHLKGHTGERAHQCNICGKGFVLKSSLNAHLGTHTRPHICTFCGKTFARSDNLRAHLRTHSKLEP